MTEETKDTGEQTQIADPAAGGTDGKADEKPEELRTVPVTALEAVRDELKTAKDQLELYQAQLNMAQHAPAPAAQTQAPKDPFEGLGDTDVMTVAEMRKVAANFQTGQASPEVNTLRNTVSKLEVAVSDPQYEQTIRTYLPGVLKQNPALLQGIQNAPNQLMAALDLARMNPEYQQAIKKDAPAATIADEIDRIIANQEKPGSAAQATGTSALSMSDRFSKMSDADIETHTAKVLAGTL